MSKVNSTNMKLGILFAICQLIFLQGLAQVPILEIGQIQGEGLVSPYLNERVSTSNNVITAITDDGFYIQSPGIRHDNNPLTSDAIKVCTGTRPQLDTNSVVSVTGTISEINNLTQFRGEDLEIELTTGFIPLPAAVTLDGAFPSPAVVALPDLEKVEGMLIEFEARAAAPKIGEGDIPLSAQEQRPFREPGIRFPGIDGIPVWDGNPEMFWLAANVMEDPNLNFLPAGSVIGCTRAVLTQSGDRYLTLPREELSIRPAGDQPPVREKQAGETTVGSLNLLMLDRTGSFFATKLSKLGLYIRDRMALPDILAVQEVRDRASLNALADELRRLQPAMDYRAYFIAGNDEFHVAYLVRRDIEVTDIEALKGELTYAGGALFDRPPLLLTVNLTDGPKGRLQILNLHLRSLIDIENPLRADFVRGKRFRQSVEVAKTVQELQDENLLIVGDYNAFEFSDGYVDVLSQIAGSTSLGAVLPPEKIVIPSLVNHTAALPQEERYSFVFQGNAELIDHCLSNRFEGLELRSVAMVRGNADFASDWAGVAGSPLRASDHDGLLAYIRPESGSSNQPDVLASQVRLDFPNPFHNGAQLLVRKPRQLLIYLDIVDHHGRVVTSYRAAAGHSNVSYTLPIHLPSGQYWIRVNGAGTGFVRPLIFING